MRIDLKALENIDTAGLVVFRRNMSCIARIIRWIGRRLNILSMSEYKQGVINWPEKRVKKDE